MLKFLLYDDCKKIDSQNLIKIYFGGIFYFYKNYFNDKLILFAEILHYHLSYFFLKNPKSKPLETTILQVPISRCWIT